MIGHLAAAWERMARVLVEPRAAIAATIDAPRPWIAAGALALPLLALGLGTLPRQLPLLDAVFPLSGDPASDTVALLMREGLTRLIVADRVVPWPTLVAAALALGVVAEPVLVLARERRAALWAIVLLGLTPVVLARGGELALTWLTRFDAGTPPGDIVLMPHRFRTGPALLWGADTPPGWLERLDGTVNLVALWALMLWARGLQHLDGAGRLAPWHVGLPLACLGGAALATWLFAPMVLAVVLGAP